MTRPITILVENCTMEIEPDAFFTRAALSKIKKVFKYINQEPWTNIESVKFLAEWLPQQRADAKERWHSASEEYVRGYRLPQNYANRKKIESANQKLLDCVKREKRKFERWNKIIDYFDTMKTKTSYFE